MKNIVDFYKGDTPLLWKIVLTWAGLIAIPTALLMLVSLYMMLFELITTGAIS